MQVDLYLASQSPRRRQLLAQIGVRFEVLAPAIDEVRRAGEPVDEFVSRMAREKAQAIVARTATAPRPVLAADTVVVLDGAMLGKPRDRADGLAMLRRLSGRTHEVISALAVIAGRRTVERRQISRVRFAELSEAAIAAYWRTGEPRDKAGAYAIQGYGAAFVAHLDGSHSGVMGLPLYETVAALMEAGVFGDDEDFLRRAGER